MNGQNAPQSRTESYGYDALNRLTSVSYGDGQTQGYAYDTMGNRTQKTDSATGTETYSTDAANRLLSVSSGNPNNGAYTNDANGNTLTGGGKVNTWDSQNRLVKVVKAGVTSEFKYGCDGLRRRSLVTNAAGEATQTDYVYDATMMVAETVRHFNGGAQVGQTENVSYLQGPQGPLYRKSSLQADPKWYVYDGLGSVVGEVDVLGNLSATKTHDVYGLTRNVTGIPTSRQGFVGGLGHVSDDETGLVYMRARYYDPSVGRFESEDPARDNGNWLSYCDGDPVNKADPSGNSATVIAGFLLGFFSELMESVYSNTAFNVGSSAWKGALGVAISIGSELAMKYYGVAGAASFGQKLAQCLKNVGVQVGGGIAGGLAFMTARYAGMIALYCVIDVIEGDSSPGTPNAPPLWHGME